MENASLSGIHLDASIHLNTLKEQLCCLTFTCSDKLSIETRVSLRQAESTWMTAERFHFYTLYTIACQLLAKSSTTTIIASVVIHSPTIRLYSTHTHTHTFQVGLQLWLPFCFNRLLQQIRAGKHNIAETLFHFIGQHTLDGSPFASTARNNRACLVASSSWLVGALGSHEADLGRTRQVIVIVQRVRASRFVLNPNRQSDVAPLSRYSSLNRHSTSSSIWFRTHLLAFLPEHFALYFVVHTLRAERCHDSHSKVITFFLTKWAKVWKK